MRPVIELRGVTKTYRKHGRTVEALAGVDLTLRPGELVAVRGPSGCGKTTLLMILGGMLRPTSGEVRVLGGDLYAMSSGQRAAFRRRELGFVFQMFHLVPYLSVLDNVLLGGSREDVADARGLLERLGIAERATHKPSALSAGESQRAGLARVMLRKPRLILADEPTGNLDPENAAAVFRILREYRDGGGTVVVVTHGSEAEQVADRTINLRGGQIVSETAASAVN